MKNQDVCADFAYCFASHTINLFSTGDKLFSYSTCIAERKEGKIFVNRTKYSPTTSKHQYYLLNALRYAKEEIVEVTDVPRGAFSLVE